MMFGRKKEKLEVAVDCRITGDHNYQPRYDEIPTLVITSDDLKAYQGGQTFEYHWVKPDTVTQVPRLDLHELTALVKAGVKKIYVGDCCPQCGNFIAKT